MSEIHAQWNQALDRAAAYVRAHGDDDWDDGVTWCPQHPFTVADLWTLYCAHRESGNTTAPTHAKRSDLPTQGETDV